MSDTDRITSREYKLMLKVNRFSNVADGTKAFWDRAKAIANIHGASVVTPDEIAEIRRQTWYIGTPAPGYKLRRRNCVLRGREELSKVVDGEDETTKRRHRLTLKFRDPSEDAARGRDVSVLTAVLDKHDAKGEPKFEQDVLPGDKPPAPPFRSKFATANTLKAKKESVVEFESFAACVERFPGLEGLEGLDPADGFEVVGRRRFHEFAHRIGKFNFDAGGETMRVKACLTFWHPTDDHSATPLVAEFSFDYDKEDDADDFPEGPVTAVEAFFEELQQETDWIDFDGTTKTSHAYESA